jgi:hypothetical protein
MGSKTKAILPPLNGRLELRAGAGWVAIRVPATPARRSGGGAGAFPPFDGRRPSCT